MGVLTAETGKLSIIARFCVRFARVSCYSRLDVY